MFEETRSEFFARRGLSIIQSSVYNLTSGIVSATKTLLTPSVLSSGYVFSTRNLQAGNEEALANSKASVILGLYRGHPGIIIV